MDTKELYEYCKNLGCCDLCCLRYLGVKCPRAYENSKAYLSTYNNEEPKDNLLEAKKSIEDEVSISGQNDDNNINIESSKDGVIQNLNGGSIDNVKEEAIANADSECIENPNHGAIESANNVAIENNNGEAIENVSVGAIDNTKRGANETNEVEIIETTNGEMEDSPPSKKRKIENDVCCSCLGILQESGWQHSFDMVKRALEEKKYECETFACALSAPIAILLREKAISLRLEERFPGYDSKSISVLKEAWKWSYGIKLGTYINKILDSGAISPLLITVNMEYSDDLQELEILKNVSPQLFEERNKQKRRFAIEFTRRSVEQALEKATLSSLLSSSATREGGLPPATQHARCANVQCVHAPKHLAGRYIKLNRNLPQSPWILDGKRMLPSSVQEIIYAPLARLYKFDEQEADRRFKIIAAGREDVDVRCLGEGRPFAIEITDPIRQLSKEELARACEEISKSGDVIVKELVSIKREDLVLLKKGEETKSKTYEALCIKLSHSKYDDVQQSSQIEVTTKDLERINSFTKPHGVIQQRTPIRVLHRRPLLNRQREILQLSGDVVPGHPQLFRISVQTTAGTYIKEWVHGEFGRSAPSLGDAMGCRVDLLALDVTAVHLEWPPSV